MKWHAFSFTDTLDTECLTKRGKKITVQIKINYDVGKTGSSFVTSVCGQSAFN